MEDFVSDETAHLDAQTVIENARAAKEPDIESIVNECSLETAGDVNAAATLLLDVLRRSYQLFFAEMQKNALHAAATQLIYRQAWANRSRIAAQAQSESQQLAAERSVAAFRSIALKWMDWPVLPGVPLKNAKKAHLDAASSKYLTDSKTYAARGNWLAAIAKKLRDDKTPVSDAMTEQEAAKLAKQFGVVKE